MMSRPAFYYKVFLEPVESTGTDGDQKVVLSALGVVVITTDEAIVQPWLRAHDPRFADWFVTWTL